MKQKVRVGGRVAGLTTRRSDQVLLRTPQEKKRGGED